MSASMNKYVTTGLLLMGAGACETSKVPVLRTAANEVLSPVTSEDSPQTVKTKRQDDDSPLNFMKVKGPLSAEDVRRSLKRRKNDFRACYHPDVGTKVVAVDRSEPSSVDRTQPRKNWGSAQTGMRDSRLTEVTVRDGVSGEVIIAYDITPGGQVENPRVVQSEVGMNHVFTECIENTLRKIQYSYKDEPTTVRNAIIQFGYSLDHVNE